MAEDNKLGRKITTLREAHHLTCQDLADRCGCDVTVIESWRPARCRRPWRR